jgi:hypothetical protein
MEDGGQRKRLFVNSCGKSKMAGHPNKPFVHNRSLLRQGYGGQVARVALSGEDGEVDFEWSV